MNLARHWHTFVTAVQFLTRVPLPGGMNRPDPDLTLLRAAVVYFPLVGGLVGLFTGSVVWAASLVWPPVVAVALGLAAEALLTGGFHEDAVADCCDAFGGGWTRDDVLRILKDSRVGSFGALGLGLALLLRGGCLLSLPAGALMPAVVASAAIGRWAVLVLMRAVPPVPHREGLSKDVGERIGLRELLVGSLFTLIALFAFAWLKPVAAVMGVVAVVAVTLAWGWYVRRRIGGVTGDVLGTACYLGQCVLLLAATGGVR
ncbi:MAG: adenosylcobinamide-GDP ribazoletransferase [Gemmataceae bacterium]|nr:adenosylcobinamide-GDP ribazoletransferase [Gemmataceae bacterium]